jgi:hypothetical protein
LADLPYMAFHGGCDKCNQIEGCTQLDVRDEIEIEIYRSFDEEGHSKISSTGGNTHTKELPNANKGRPMLPQTAESLQSQRMNMFIRDAEQMGKTLFAVSLCLSSDCVCVCSPAIILAARGRL